MPALQGGSEESGKGDDPFQIRSGESGTGVERLQSVFSEQCREIAVAFDDLELFIRDHDSRGDAAEQGVGFFLRLFLEVGYAHGRFGASRQKRLCEIAAGVVTAAVAVEFIFRRVLADAAERRRNLIDSRNRRLECRSREVVADPAFCRTPSGLFGQTRIVEDAQTLQQSR